MHHIKFTIVEHTDGVKSFTDIVAEVPESTSLPHLQRAMDAFLLDYYTNSEWDTSDNPPYKILTDHGSLCWIWHHGEITEGDFMVLRRHMNNQTFNVNACLTKTT